MKPPLLFLAHRIPYPPNKGDKIRSFNLLRHLSAEFEIHLGCFIDDPEDQQHREVLQQYSASSFFVDLQPTKAKWLSLTALLGSEPLSCRYYRNADMQQWVDRTLAEHTIQHVVVYSSQMAQFVEGERYSSLCRVMDFVDVDSAKWTQYAQSKPWPLSILYQREGRVLLDHERTVAGRFDRSVFVSKKELEHFVSLTGMDTTRLSFVNNGVDADYFSPALEFDAPYSNGERPVLFVGAMDYWPNVDAVHWFADKVLDRVRGEHADAVFYIVGSNPDAAVQRLGQREGIQVTGRVADVRPYLRHCELVVAPLQIARGIQNKVLEAMAMGRSTVATPAALEGIEAMRSSEVVSAESPDAFAHEVSSLLHQPAKASEIGIHARSRICHDYGWQSNLETFSSMLDA